MWFVSFKLFFKKLKHYASNHFNLCQLPLYIMSTQTLIYIATG